MWHMGTYFKKYQCIAKLFEWISHYIACVNQASTFIHPNTARKVSKVEAQNIFFLQIVHPYGTHLTCPQAN